MENDSFPYALIINAIPHSQTPCGSKQSKTPVSELGHLRRSTNSICMIKFHRNN